MNPETMKTIPRITTKAIPIPLFIDIAGFPTKPVNAKRNARETRRTANQGTIVPMYLIAPPAETKIVAMKRARKILNHLLSSKSFVLARIA